MIGRFLDGLLPTRGQPEPVLESAAEPTVLLDRGLAVLVDLVVCFVFLEAPAVYVLGELAPAAYDALGGAVASLSLVALAPVYVTYSFAFEWRYGRTPGKVNRGLMVAMETGEQCSLRASGIRNLLRYVDFLGVPPLVVGLLSALLADGRRVGDLLAGTVVVRTRAPADVRSAPAATIDTSAAGRARADERRRREPGR